MKIFNSTVLGTAACLVALSGAHAADLPVKAKAVEYVRICSLYGNGFYFIPGTDTCIKLGGYMRADVTFNGGGIQGTPAWSGLAGQKSRLSNYYFARARENLNVDTRTATEYGVVRTYFDANFSWTTGTYAAAAAGGVGGTAYSASPLNQADGATSGGGFAVNFAFIQFAGFTIGRAVSMFDAPFAGYPANITDALLGGHSDQTGVNQFSYTADFGQGISGTVSLQDQVTYYQTNLWNASGLTAAGFAAGAYGTNNFGGTRSPDIVGMLRVDQAWGMFQASVAAHNIHAGYYGAAETSGHPSDKWGWAGQLAMTIKNLPTGKGDDIDISFGYSDGASRYVWQSLVAPTVAMYGSSALAGVYQGLSIGGVSDGIFTTGNGIETTKLWGFRTGYTHNWNSQWNSALFGSYTSVSYNATTRGYICATVTTFLTPGSTCNPNFNVAQIGTNTRWSPVKNLTFTGELMYTHVDQQYSGVAALPAVSVKPAALYELKDQGTLSLAFRAQRNW
ncbi:porin [Bradyrhizobium sp. AUGA SZCCT0169]|uniref:porin n=1 Tax=Bradyrhizobium sp. AUGA SZCCT0169 TaxID=2807663 RepID=UPI001BAA3492|nr:porin [Bradyrhizobium sp. AUGA SZCCT0169]MBR1251503.1 porin [Bradyrhizobium sp. AUGA SZCCT0169]